MKSIEAREPSYVIEVRGPSESVLKFLREQSEVTSAEVVSHGGDLTEFELKARERKDPRESLASKIASKGWHIRRLDLKRVNLDALFNEVVRSRHLGLNQTRRQQRNTEPGDRGQKSDTDLWFLSSISCFLSPDS